MKNRYIIASLLTISAFTLQGAENNHQYINEINEQLSLEPESKKRNIVPAKILPAKVIIDNRTLVPLYYRTVNEKSSKSFTQYNILFGDVNQGKTETVNVGFNQKNKCFSMVEIYEAIAKKNEDESLFSTLYTYSPLGSIKLLSISEQQGDIKIEEKDLMNMSGEFPLYYWTTAVVKWANNISGYKDAYIATGYEKPHDIDINKTDDCLTAIRKPKKVFYLPYNSALQQYAAIWIYVRNPENFQTLKEIAKYTPSGKAQCIGITITADSQVERERLDDENQDF